MAINFLNSVDFNKNELLNPTIENQPNDASAGTGVAGQLYFNTTDGILKVWDGSWSEVGGGVTSLTTTDGTYIDLTPNSPTTGPVTVTADLSAVDGTAAAGERYLTKTNKWATIASIPGTYTFNVTADTGTPETINSGDTLDIAGGTYISTAVGATDTVTINHDATSRTDTTTTPAQLAFGGTFSAATSVTTNSTGHVTAINLATYQLPAAPSNPTITLTGDVTGSGTTSIATTISASAVEFTMLDPTMIITEAEGIENNDNDTTIPTSAAVKDYVDSNIVGGLVYQGGYNAATNTPNLDNNPSPNPIKKGWTYTVTADGSFFTEQVRVGDVLIAEQDAPTVLADWTTVQNNVDLASLTQVGIGNVNAATAGELDGLSVTYSSGTATVGFDVDSLTQSTPTSNADAFLPYYDDAAGENKKLTFSQLSTEINTGTSFAATISATGNITHNLGTRDVVIQLYDTVTYETVYADVDRISTTQATITFAATPANSIRVLVQKIG